MGEGIPDCDCIEFRAVRGGGVVMIASFKGHEMARSSLTFDEARDMGAQLFALAEEYGIKGAA